MNSFSIVRFWIITDKDLFSGVFKTCWQSTRPSKSVSSDLGSLHFYLPKCHKWHLGQCWQNAHIRQCLDRIVISLWPSQEQTDWVLTHLYRLGHQGKPHWKRIFYIRDTWKKKNRDQIKMCDDEIAALVVDNGSGMCKAGFAGDDAPR